MNVTMAFKVLWLIPEHCKLWPHVNPWQTPPSADDAIPESNHFCGQATRSCEEQPHHLHSTRSCTCAWANRIDTSAVSIISIILHHIWGFNPFQTKKYSAPLAFLFLFLLVRGRRRAPLVGTAGVRRFVASQLFRGLTGTLLLGLLGLLRRLGGLGLCQAGLLIEKPNKVKTQNTEILEFMRIYKLWWIS